MIARFLDRMFAAYSRLFLRWRVALLVIVLCLVGGLASQARTLRFDNSPESLFLQNDEVLLQYQRFQQKFGSDEYALLVFERKEAWTPEFVRDLRALAQELGKLTDVIEATSIANARYLSGAAGELIVGDFLPVGGQDAAELERRRELARNHPYYRDLLVSGQGNYLGVVIRTAIHPGQVDYKIALSHSIREIIGRAPYRDWNIRAVGSPVLDADVREIVTRESGLYLVLSVVLTAALLFVVFRAVYAVVLPLLVGLLSILCAFGVMALLNAPFGLLSPIVPSFLLSVGIAPSVFLLWEYFQGELAGKEPPRALAEAIERSGSSSFLSMLTTAAGLLAFSSSKIRPVQELGLTIGLTLIVAFGLALVLVPFALSLRRRSLLSQGRARMISGQMRFFGSVAAWVLQRRNVLAASFGGLVVLSAAGIVQIEADYHYLGLFKHHVPIRQSYAFVDDAMKGSSSIEVVIQSSGEGGVKQPELLAAMLEVERQIEHEFSAMGTKAYSVADLVAEINQALNEGDARHYSIPPTQAGVAEALMLYQLSGDDELDKLVTPNFSEARLRIAVRNQSDAENSRLFTGVNAALAQRLGSLPVSTSTTGLVYLWTQVSDYLAVSEAQALGITAVVVAMALAIVFQSVPLGLFMAGMNLAAVGMTLGMMGWAGIPLDPYTMLIASIALGILDDDSVHFIRDVQRRLDECGDLEQAVTQAMSGSAPGMLFLSAALVGGFSVYAFSEIASLTKFGLLVAFTILVGAVVEFVLGPAVLVTVGAGLFRKEAKLIHKTEPAE